MNATNHTPGLQQDIDAANNACAQWERANFNLGSPFAHCARLKSFASADLKAACERGEVRINMPSEYHAPRFVLIARATGQEGGQS